MPLVHIAASSVLVVGPASYSVRRGPMVTDAMRST